MLQVLRRVESLGRLLLFLGWGGSGGLFGFLAFLEARGELVFALVAFPPQAGAAADGALGGGSFVREFEDDDAAAVADAMLGGLDDAGVAAGTVGELGGDLAEEFLHHALAGEFLLIVH